MNNEKTGHQRVNMIDESSVIKINKEVNDYLNHFSSLDQNDLVNNLINQGVKISSVYDGIYNIIKYDMAYLTKIDIDLANQFIPVIVSNMGHQRHLLKIRRAFGRDPKEDELQKLFVNKYPMSEILSYLSGVIVFDEILFANMYLNTQFTPRAINKPIYDVLRSLFDTHFDDMILKTYLCVEFNLLSLKNLLIFDIAGKIDCCKFDLQNLTIDDPSEYVDITILDSFNLRYTRISDEKFIEPPKEMIEG